MQCILCANFLPACGTGCQALCSDTCSLKDPTRWVLVLQYDGPRHCGLERGSNLPTSGSHVFSETLPLRCNMRGNSCHPSAGCCWLWTGFAQFREDSELFSGGLYHRISAEGHLGVQPELELGLGLFSGSVHNPISFSCMYVCLLEPGPWLLKGKNHEGRWRR